MKKRVKYQGENIKIDFEVSILNKQLPEMDPLTGAFRASGTRIFKINNTEYKVGYITNRGKGQNSKPSRSNYFEGAKFGDSDKKVIEFIIENHGL